MSASKPLHVVSPLKFRGERHMPGAVLSDCTAAESAELLALGVVATDKAAAVQPPNNPPPKPAPAKRTRSRSKKTG